MNIYYILNKNNPQIFIEMVSFSKPICQNKQCPSKNNKYIFVDSFNTFYDVLFNKDKFNRMFYEL